MSDNDERKSKNTISKTVIFGAVASAAAVVLLIIGYIIIASSTTQQDTDIRVREIQSPTATTQEPTPNPTEIAAVATITTILEDTEKETATPVPRNRVQVTKTQYGEDWPLTVSSGWVSMENCKSIRAGSGKFGEHIFTTNEGKKYALNGFALQAGYPNIQQITRKVPYGYGADRFMGFHSGTWELSEVARKMCN